MKFWLVWNPIGHAPAFMHLTYEDAVLEAKRLIALQPRAEFHVLELTYSIVPVVQQPVYQEIQY